MCYAQHNEFIIMNNGNYFILDVKVTPHARQDKVEGWKEGRLCVRLRQVPEKGKANRQLIEYLADELDIAPSRIEILSGETSRLKRLRIQGITEDALKRWQQR